MVGNRQLNPDLDVRVDYGPSFDLAELAPLFIIGILNQQPHPSLSLVALLTTAGSPFEG